MKSSVEEITPIIGTAMDGGYYAGRIKIRDQVFALIVAPKVEGEHDDTAWIEDYKDVPSSKSYCDGQANTMAMAEAGSKLALWALSLDIAGHADWYLPSQDELEILYRNLKPTTRKNEQWGRCGINVSAVTPTYPYTPELPLQTSAELFQAGNAQAFEKAWYWSSTQHASDSDYAWIQDFGNGYQSNDNKSYQGRARAVRRSPI